MAKVESMLFSVMRGSIAGTTYRMGRGGGIIATSKPFPTNPSSPGQVFLRGTLTGLSGQWLALSDAQRAAWNAFAAALPTFIDGRTAFIACLSKAFWAYFLPDVPAIKPGIDYSAPSIASGFAIGDFLVTPYATIGPPPKHGVKITYLMSDLEEGFLNVQWAGPFNKTRNFPKVHFKHGDGAAFKIDPNVIPGEPEIKTLIITNDDVPWLSGERYMFRITGVSGATDPSKKPHRPAPVFFQACNIG